MPIDHLYVFFERCLFRCSAHVLIVFSILNFISYLYILDISLISHISFVNIFSFSVGTLLALLTVSLAVQKACTFN